MCWNTIQDIHHSSVPLYLVNTIRDRFPHWFLYPGDLTCSGGQALVPDSITMSSRKKARLGEDKCMDGNTDTVCTTKSEPYPSITLDFGHPVDIAQVILGVLLQCFYRTHSWSVPYLFCHWLTPVVKTLAMFYCKMAYLCFNEVCLSSFSISKTDFTTFSRSQLHRTRDTQDCPRSG